MYWVKYKNDRSPSHVILAMGDPGTNNGNISGDFGAGFGIFPSLNTVFYSNM